MEFKMIYSNYKVDIYKSDECLVSKFKSYFKTNDTDYVFVDEKYENNIVIIYEDEKYDTIVSHNNYHLIEWYNSYRILSPNEYKYDYTIENLNIIEKEL